MHRVKLPKSFLAVNLSESHTFHKKEELHESENYDGASSLEMAEDDEAVLATVEMTSENLGDKDTGTSSANGNGDGWKADS
jgi:inositol hexakisphosphate/diphosphoinositol-pentakisphosphate kinase